MEKLVNLNVNGATHQITLDPETPLLFALRNDLAYKGAKLGCALEQCHACTVLIDGAAVPSCKIPVSQVEGLEITTLEALGTPDDLHALQAAFIDQQAIQCGTCVNGMIMAAEGLLRRERYPTDEQIKEALERNLCRCGVYDRVRRAIHLRTGREVGKQWSVVSDRLSEGQGAGLASHARSDTEDNVEHRIETLGSLKINPDLDSWIKIDVGGTVTVMTGKVEIGQGLKTAVAQIAAEELDVAFERVNVIDADTRITPNEGITAGSMSMETSGRAIRQAAADARHILLKLAFEELEAETPADQLQVNDGVVVDPATGRQTDYWHLHANRPFGVAVSGVGQPKSPADYTVIGQPLERTDLVGKVTGTFEYLHDLELPDMVHARVIRPSGPATQLKAIDLDSISVKELDGVLKIVHDGSFLGVICEREEQAVWATAELRSALAEVPSAKNFPTHQTIYEEMKASHSIDFAVVNGVGIEGPPPEPQPLTQNAHHATYTRPFGMHASLLPSAAVAHAEPDSDNMQLWVQTQGVFPQRDTIAPILGIDPADLTVIHMEGAGCYGNNGADDCALDAALLARAFPGRPVMLKWTRADEHGREPYTSPMIVEMAAEVDADGTITQWHHDVWSYTHLNRPMAGTDTSAYIAAQEIANGMPKPAELPRFYPHIGEYRNADPLYAFENKQITSHFIPDSPFKTSSLRTLGGFANLFGIESFMDELAHAAGEDPIAYRLRHMQNERAIAVIKATAEHAGWQPRTKPHLTGKGRGFAFNQYKNIQSYCGMVVDVTVDDVGKITLDKVLMAVDSGEVINPDGLANQMEGGFVQAASWALFEQVTFDENGVTSLDWDSYPILRFPDAPVIETVILDRPDYPFLGAGEASSGPVAAAIANAVFDATGKRLREIPFNV